MKRIFTALLCAISLCSFAQNDSVSLGSGANKMVFYNVTTGVKTSASNDDWHLAFSARYINGFTHTNQATTIRINEAYGLKLFRSPNQKLTQFSSFDTTGWQGWQQMHNPDTTWDIGAFNINKNFNDQFNYGWGEYRAGDHNIYSDSSMYLILLPDGSFKKFTIINLLYDSAFNVQYANLDNSNLLHLEVRKNPYSNKNFVYVNLNNTTILDKEPALATWDLMFFRYNNTVYTPSDLSQDIGVFTRDGVRAYAASGTTAQQTCYSGSYSAYINAIGKSWMGQPGDTVIPGLAYFLQTPSGTYKYSATGFGGALSGEVDFTIGICQLSGIHDINTNTDLSIYPVPASDQISVKINSLTETSTDISLLDMSGRLIITQNSTIQIGENIIPINLSALQSGNYIISISSASGKVNKLISVLR